MAPTGLLNRPLARHGLCVAAEHNSAVRSFFADAAAEGAITSKRYNGVQTRTVGDALAKAPIGRERAWARIERTMGMPPLVREPKMRLWRHLVGRDHPLMLPEDRPGRPSVGRDAVEVRYVAVGNLPCRLVASGGAWSFGVSDHAVGRLMERHGGLVDPRQAIMEAHDALLSLTADEVAVLLEAERWTVPTASGAFLVIVRMIVAASEGQVAAREGELNVYAFANTYLPDDMMQADQEAQAALLRRRGPRYLDGALAPAALRPPIHLPPDALQ